MVPLRGGDPGGRRGISSVSFLTAGGRVDADFSIIGRTCGRQAPCVVLDLRWEWHRIVEARRRQGVWDTGSPSELVVDQTLREHKFTIMEDFTYGLHIQPTSIDSAFNLFHGCSKVLVTPFAACQNSPSQEEARDSARRKFWQVCGDGGGQKVHNNSEWEAFAWEFRSVTRVPSRGAFQTLLRVACDAPVTTSKRPEVFWKTCVQERCAGSFQHCAHGAFGDTVGLGASRGGAFMRPSHGLCGVDQRWSVVTVEEVNVCIACEISEGGNSRFTAFVGQRVTRKPPCTTVKNDKRRSFPVFAGIGRAHHHVVSSDQLAKLRG
jgi:hypothetical protein